MDPVDRVNSTEPFPSVDQPSTTTRPRGATLESVNARPRRSSSASQNVGGSRASKLSRAFLESNPPAGFMMASGEVAAKVPTLNEIRTGGFSHDGWNAEGQMENRGNAPLDIHKRRLSRTNTNGQRSTMSSMRSQMTPMTPLGLHNESDEFFPAPEIQDRQDAARIPTTIQEGDKFSVQPSKVATQSENLKEQRDVQALTTPSHPSDMIHPDESGMYPNGYRFPPKHTWQQSTAIGLKAFWKFFLTPFGFIVVVYGLNVVAWGAMIFFVLLKACPAMCHPSCDDLSSARKKWIEYDSQILNALFCVTGFGLIPWRFRDAYYVIKWRMFGDKNAFRRLAGINRSWFRLPGSDQLPEHVGPPPVYSKKNPITEVSPPPYSEAEVAEMEANPAIPLPATAMAPAPLTGVRAPPTKPWLIDLCVWMMVMNTLLQGALAGCMWGFNRFNRPGATTGIFITFGCIVAIVAGIVAFKQGKKVKNVEGIPVHEEEVIVDIEKREDEKIDRKIEKLKGKRWFERH